MKKLNVLYLFLALTIILGSCGTSNSVVSNRLISKRKYNKGFHINNNGNFKKSSDDVAKEEVEVKESKDRKSSVVKATTNKDVNQRNTESNVYASVETETEVVMEQVASTDRIESDSPSDEASSFVSVVETKEATTTRESIKDSRNELVKMKKVRGSNGNSSDSMFILAVICAILIPPLGVGIYTNIDWMKVLIALLLTLLFWLPGMIYALLVVFDVI
jgi:uncharacterized membrane protein YqaE (UPF0057 family)